MELLKALRFKFKQKEGGGSRRQQRTGSPVSRSSARGPFEDKGRKGVRRAPGRSTQAEALPRKARARPGPYRPDSSEAGAGGLVTGSRSSREERRREPSGREGRAGSHRHAPRPTRATPGQPDAQRHDPAAVPRPGKLGAQRRSSPDPSRSPARPSRDKALTRGD